MSYVYVLSDRKGLYYVGKTTDIRQRIIQHKSDIRCQAGCTSRYLDPDFTCDILEEYSNEIDLAQGERKYHDIYRNIYGDKLVNNNQPLRTKAEWQAQYYAENAEEIKAQKKQYYAENAEEIRAKNNQKYTDNSEHYKQYRVDHVEEKSEYDKQYRAENLDKIKARAKQKYNCECGGRYTHSNKTQHLKSFHHLLHSTLRSGSC